MAEYVKTMGISQKIIHKKTPIFCHPFVFDVTQAEPSRIYISMSPSPTIAHKFWADCVLFLRG